ncbi:MAG: hypothetical protein ACON3Z_18615 [Bradymonadia bacterium]
MQRYSFGIVLALTFFSGCQDSSPPNQTVRPDVGTSDAGMISVDSAAPDLAVMPIDAAPPPPDSAPIPETSFRVETVLSMEETAAGNTQRVTCSVLYPDGSPVDDVITRVEIRPAVGWAVSGDERGTYIGQRAGEYQVRCLAGSLGLQDTTPAQWQVVAGPAARLTATAEPAEIRAGSSSTVGCLAEDAYGNETTPSNIMYIAQPNNITFTGNDATGTTAGRHLISCTADGVASSGGAPLVIQPAEGAELIVSLSPQRDAYTVGTILTSEARLVDAFGNEVTDSPIRWSMIPELPGFGRGRFQLTEEGIFTLTVSAALEDGATIERTFTIRVDSSGPTIRCLSPAPNAMLRLSDDVILRGEVSDTSTVGLVEVDGIPVPIDDAGGFSWPLDTAPGINTVTVTALDEFGQETQIICPFFVAESYVPEADSIDDAITLDFGPSAIDDGPGANPLQSFADLFRLVVESPALIQVLNDAALSQNPLINNRCLQDSFFGCLFRATVRYQSLQIRGSKTVSLGLYDGGLTFSMRLNNVRVNVAVSGTLSSSGYVEARSIQVGGRFRLTVNAQGVPELTGENQTITVGALESDFGGFAGFLIDLIFPLVEGTIRNELVNTLGSFIGSELDTILSGALGGLDLSAFSLGFDVESPSGEPIQLQMPTSLSTMNATEQRLRVGLSTRVNGPIRNALPSAGVPVFGPLAAPERMEPGNLSALINLGLVNQLLHGLWRANFFGIEDAGALLGDDSAGLGFSFQLLVPPAVEAIPGEDAIRLHFGPAEGALSYPELFEEPIGLIMAATLTLDIGLTPAGELQFGADGLNFESLRLLVEGVQMEAADQEALEQDLGRVVQSLAAGALGQALPSLPVPAINLPDDLIEYGVPAGTSLGIANPRFGLSETHILLDGELGP